MNAQVTPTDVIVTALVFGSFSIPFLRRKANPAPHGQKELLNTALTAKNRARHIAQRIAGRGYTPADARADLARFYDGDGDIVTALEEFAQFD